MTRRRGNSYAVSDSEIRQKKQDSTGAKEKKEEKSARVLDITQNPGEQMEVRFIVQ
jgi:hypothetical protein